MKNFGVIVSAAMASIALTGCPKPTTEKTFADLADACVSPQLKGPLGQVVFFGPNSYEPGDLFTRSQDKKGLFYYSGEARYADQVSPQTVAAVVKEGTVPAGCAFNSETSLKVNVAADAVFSAAAIPVEATGGINFNAGTVTAIKAKKLYVNTIPYFIPYNESIKNLPNTNAARSAVTKGGYFAATAVLVVEGYSVDVSYGPTFDASTAAKAKLSIDDTKKLNGNVSIAFKDKNSLTFTVEGKTALAIIARPFDPNFSVQSESTPAPTPQPTIAATLNQRSGYSK